MKKSVAMNADAKAEISINKESQVVVGQQLVDPQNRVVEQLQWKGVKDLSAKAVVSRRNGTLNITVQVTDDKLVNAFRDGRLYDGDCVEIFLDLRGPAKRFTLPKSKGYHQILVPAPVKPDFVDKYDTFGETIPGLAVRSARTAGGYEVSLSIPLQWVQGDAAVLGFDVAVDDADGPRGRRTQLSWAETSKGHADPRKLGLLITRNSQE